MHGAWLSLVERVVRDYEVAGSNPVAPIYNRTSAIMLVSFFCAIRPESGCRACTSRHLPGNGHRAAMP